MRVIDGVCIDELYRDACELLTDDPDFISSPRDLKIRECLNVALVLHDPSRSIVTLPTRDLSLHYLAGELLFYLRGSNLLSMISHYSSFWNKISDDGMTVNSCYGKRVLFDEYHGATQFQYALNQLLKDRDSRKAVMNIYTPFDNKLDSKDNPCTMALQFIIRENKLYLTVYMRSNDIWLGTPYDIAFFTLLQRMMMRDYNRFSNDLIDLGTYTHIAGSLHVYEKNWEEVSRACDDRATNKESWDAQRMPDITDAFDHDISSVLSYEEKKRNRMGYFVPEVSDPFLKWIVKILEEGKK